MYGRPHNRWVPWKSVYTLTSASSNQRLHCFIRRETDFSYPSAPAAAKFLDVVRAPS
jgi:hypothetical protein